MDRPFEDWCSGDADAARLIRGLWEVIFLWDDVVDHDNRTTEERVNATFWWLLFEMPHNPFWVKHRQQLEPVMKIAAINWMTANALQRSGDRNLVAEAYGLRCSYYDIWLAIVRIASGDAMAAKVALELRARTDSFDEFMVEHLKET